MGQKRVTIVLIVRQLPMRCSPRAPGFSRQQCARPHSSVQWPESIIQGSESIVHRPESSVQHLRPEPRNSGMPLKNVTKRNNVE